MTWLDVVGSGLAVGWGPLSLDGIGCPTCGGVGWLVGGGAALSPSMGGGGWCGGRGGWCTSLSLGWVVFLKSC